MIQPRSLLDQIQSILSKYRNMSLLDLKNKDKRQELVTAINETTIPSYHKEVMTLGLLTDNDGETVLAMYIAKQQEQLRHLQALLTIERNVLEERSRKLQSR